MTTTELASSVADWAILNLPVDRYGRKADKLVVTLGAIELDRTSRDDVGVFDSLERGAYVDLRIRAFVTRAGELSQTDEDGNEQAAFARVLKVTRIEKG